MLKKFYENYEVSTIILENFWKLFCKNLRKFAVKFDKIVKTFLGRFYESYLVE